MRNCRTCKRPANFRSFVDEVTSREPDVRDNLVDMVHYLGKQFQLGLMPEDLVDQVKAWIHKVNEILRWEVK